MTYAHEQLFLSRNCMMYAVCITGRVCGEFTAHWRIPLQTINSTELCGFIYDFRIAGGALMLHYSFQHCWPSVGCLHLFPLDPPHNRREALVYSFMFVPTSC